MAGRRGNPSGPSTGLGALSLSKCWIATSGCAGLAMTRQTEPRSRTRPAGPDFTAFRMTNQPLIEIHLPAGRGSVGLAR